MIALGLGDYVVLFAIFAVVLLKIISDFRDVSAARAAKRGLRAVAKKSFSPRLNIIIPVQSIENTKQTLRHINDYDLSVTTVLVTDSKNNPKVASILRYFVKKHSVKNVKVIARKQPNFIDIAAEYAKNGLVVMLPDTTRLNSSFYWENILPFGDTAVDALELVPNVRPDKTLTSGIEVLFTAWRRYISFGENRARSELSQNILPEGVIIRAKYSRRMPKKQLGIVQTRKSSYSVSAQRNLLLNLNNLQESVNFTDLLTVLIMTGIGAFLLSIVGNVLLIAGVFVVLYGAVVWWSLGAMRIEIIDRLSVLLLSPVFLVTAWGLLIVRSLRFIRSS